MQLIPFFYFFKQFNIALLLMVFANKLWHFLLLESVKSFFLMGFKASTNFIFPLDIKQMRFQRKIKDFQIRFNI